MIVRSGNAVSFLIEFPSGRPDGNISWKVLGEGEAELDFGTLVVPANAVSANLRIDGENNRLTAGASVSYRDVEWEYTVLGEVVTGEVRYSVESRVPFGVSNDGVRTKLGVTSLEVDDKDISLVRAYQSFVGLVGPLDAVFPDNDLVLRDAIEALAALALIPSMPVRLAVKEQSGSDIFQRDKVNWGTLALSLDALVTAGVLAVTPGFDPVAGFGTLFLLAPPSSDAVTGEGSLG